MKNLVEIYARMNIEFPHLKAITIAQWILESGRGSSLLYKDFNNAAGLKYRPEMKGICKPVKYKAWDGLDDYCHFASLEDFIKGYWIFIDRPPYKGWRDHVANEKSYINYIVKAGYCPDNGYVDKVLALLPEAKKMLLEAEKAAPKEVTWFERNRNDKGETVIVAFAGETPVAILTSNDIAIQREFEDRYSKAKQSRVAPAGKAVPGLPDYNRGPVPAKKSKIALNSGHNDKRVGARSYDGKVREEKLNQAQTAHVKSILTKAGYTVVELSHPNDDLEAIGKMAAGCDCLVSFHHNTAEGMTSDGGAEVLYNRNGKQASVELATVLAEAVSKAVGNRNRGAKPRGLSILSASEPVCKGPCVLVESFFISTETDEEAAKKKSIRAAEAVAQVLMSMFE